VERNRIIVGDNLEVMQSMATGCVRLTITSPPYEDARLYLPLKFKAKGQKWVDWMIPRVVEMCRVLARR
jgi:DNA modification methylase